jgi:hypothetical protein
LSTKSAMPRLQYPPFDLYRSRQDERTWLIPWAASVTSAFW